MIAYHEFGEDRFFDCDGAPADVAARRRQAFYALADDYRARYPRTIALKSEVKEAISDMQFTDAYRVPFPFSRLVRENLGASPFLEASTGVTLTDVDGNHAGLKKVSDNKLSPRELQLVWNLQGSLIYLAIRQYV